MNGIETERTILRLFTMDDLDDLASILGNPQVMKYLELDCKPLSRETTETALTNIISHWEMNGFGRWAVVSREDNKLIGMAGFRTHDENAELVYILDEPYWGRGLATEIARAILEYGFEKHKFPGIIAMTRPANVLSRRVMDKLGMKFEGEAIVYGIPVVEYSISKEDYIGKHSEEI
jgi:RimJ/RimL family protein N-acetyltransferase